jgi:uncharacterized protein YciI
MKYFALFYHVVDDFVERRTVHREEHLRLARAAHSRGELLLGGALIDPADQALLVFRAPDRSVVEEFARHDPYVIHGLVTRWEVRSWAVIFLAAIKLEIDAERAAYLDQACAADTELRDKLEALLRSLEARNPLGDTPPRGMVDKNGGEFLADTITRSDSTADKRNANKSTSGTGPVADASNEPTLASGQHDHRSGHSEIGIVISGRYTLIEVIGEGGMGSVYRARQSEPVRRDVALKLIKTGMDSRAVVARFDAERQALALMDHPNIARVFDGGTTSSGQLFFVMELVHGVPLTEFCDQRRLTVNARLELFV